MNTTAELRITPAVALDWASRDMAGTTDPDPYTKVDGQAGTYRFTRMELEELAADGEHQADPEAGCGASHTVGMRSAYTRMAKAARAAAATLPPPTEAEVAAARARWAAKAAADQAAHDEWNREWRERMAAR